MYTVYVDDNFHYEDESKREKLGEFQSAAEAIAAARKLVDSYLDRAFEPGMTAEALFRSFTTFGRDPFIVPSEGTGGFSAWKYAKARCRERCGEAPSGTG